MKIEILGDGCSICTGLKRDVEKAVAELGIHADIESTMDMKMLSDYQAKNLPMLVINDVLQKPRNTLSLREIKSLLQRSH